jgi:hypothetical protein
MSEELDLIKALAPITTRVRTDATAVKGRDAQGWTKQPLTQPRMLAHLGKGPARGCCPIKAGESTTLLALFDLDSHGGETTWDAMAAVAEELCQALELFGMRPIAFRSSGGRGIHIFMLWDTPQDAYSVRCALQDALESIGYTNGTDGVQKKQIEIFPKQNSVPLSGYGNQFILPLSGQSVPLDRMFGFEPMPRDAVVDLGWPVSEPVVFVEHTEAEQTITVPEHSREQIKEALMTIPNGEGNTESLSYDAWRDLMFAIHFTFSGDDEGLELAHEFSAKSPKFDPEFLDNRVWPYIRNDREGMVITDQTIINKAREFGYHGDVLEAFETLPAVRQEEEPHDRPRYVRNKAGKILTTLPNVVLALSDPMECGVTVAYDEFRAVTSISTDLGNSWRVLTDEDVVQLRITLEKIGFKECPGREMARDALMLVAAHKKFDSARVWLSRLRWDGVPRVSGFLPHYWHTKNTEYTRAVGRYIWSALAGRVMKPGCKADMAPIAVGPQGAQKSSGVAAMAPNPEFFREINLTEKETDLARKMRGALVGELGEMRGFRAKEVEAIKSWMARSTERWTPKYKEFDTEYPRRVFFMGTSNPRDVLTDTTGNRRWLPFDTQKVDSAAIARDCEQLWAEGLEIYKAEGIAYREAEKLAAAEHDDFMEHDSWEPVVERWLQEEDLLTGEVPADLLAAGGFIPTLDILAAALQVPAERINRAIEQRVTSVMSALGYSQTRRRKNGIRMKGWEVAGIAPQEKGE